MKQSETKEGREALKIYKSSMVRVVFMHTIGKKFIQKSKILSNILKDIDYFNKIEDFKCAILFPMHSFYPCRRILLFKIFDFKGNHARA